MKIMHDLGNFSWATAESSRKIISKSKGKAMFEKMRKEFVRNTKKVHNISEKESSKIFDVVSTFGSYGFNEAHAIEYSIISYWCAWLKTYYPQYFFTALLSREKNSTRIADYVRDAKDNGIAVEKPNINKSKADYTIENDKIYAGFNAIKQIANRSVAKIIKGQPYKSFEDFLRRCGSSKTIIKNLVLAGAFDCWNINWKYIIDNIDTIKKTKEYAPNIPDHDNTKKTFLQMEVLDLPPEKNPIDFFKDPFQQHLKYEAIGELDFDENIDERWIKGIVTFINFKQEGLEGQWAMFDNVLERRYAHLNVNDGTGNVLVHLSPEQYTYYKKYLEKGTGFPVIIKGHSIKNYNKIYCDAMLVLNDIDYQNPVIGYIKKEKKKRVLELKKKFPNYYVDMITAVTYKVSKNKNPYARIKFKMIKTEYGLLCFELTEKIFVAGEILVFEMKKEPFIHVVKRYV